MIRFIAFSSFTGGLKAFPEADLDKNVTILIIRGPKNSITIGPIFSQFKQLEEIRIVDSNVPAIGQHTFWGLTKLRKLGKFYVFLYL